MALLCKLAYKTPLCDLCETNALSQGVPYSQGGSYMPVYRVVLLYNLFLP